MGIGLISSCSDDADATHNQAFLAACREYNGEKLAQEELDELTVLNTRANTGYRFIQRLTAEHVLTSPKDTILKPTLSYRPHKARTDKAVRFRQPDSLVERHSYQCDDRSDMFYNKDDYRLFKSQIELDMFEEIKAEATMDLEVEQQCMLPVHYLLRQRSNATGIGGMNLRQLKTHLTNLARAHLNAKK